MLEPAAAPDWAVELGVVVLLAPDWSEALGVVVLLAPDWSEALGVVVLLAPDWSLDEVVLLLLEAPVSPGVVAGCEYAGVLLVDPLVGLLPVVSVLLLVLAAPGPLDGVVLVLPGEEGDVVLEGEVVEGVVVEGVAV